MNHDEKNPELVRSHKIHAGRRRTCFIDIRRTKGDDFYISLTESARRKFGDGFDRHTIYLYKEDFNRFLDGLEDMIHHIKTELMPDFDFDEFDRRQQEWEARKAQEDEQGRPVHSRDGDDNE